MDIKMIGDKDPKPGDTTPAERAAPQRDGQGGGDHIPSRSAPTEDPSEK